MLFLLVWPVTWVVVIVLVLVSVVVIVVVAAVVVDMFWIWVRVPLWSCESLHQGCTEKLIFIFLNSLVCMLLFVVSVCVVVGSVVVLCRSFRFLNQSSELPVCSLSLQFHAGAAPAVECLSSQRAKCEGQRGQSVRRCCVNLPRRLCF